MRRFNSIADNDEKNDVDISPLIDVVFILLIFFIVTTVFVEEPGVDINKPIAASAKNLQKNSILIAVTEEGGVVYAGRDIGISGVQPLVKRMTQKEDLPVILQADRGANLGLLMKVHDQAKLAGAVVNVSTLK